MIILGPGPGGVCTVPERRTSAQHSRLLSGLTFDSRAPEEAVILHTLLPKIFTFVSTFEEELDRVFVVSLETNKQAAHLPPTHDGL